ncbi:SDR family oxidoreductase [Dyadobacter tibetensis]|uniref:SDR family oxidoreductase n=1 Tax=Dyadobacter tibetensis TaxID=1211851 RepID=UPI0004703BF0|nr:NAD(P)-dependent oxidoreductase [Dyadobacter tibetensis]
MTTNKKRILITGSNGLLGQKLVALLLTRQEVTVIATSSGRNRLPFQEGYIYHEMDVTNPDSLEKVITLTKPQVIIHTAAMTNVDTCELEKEMCWKINVTAVEYLVEICSRLDIFLQYVSTDFVFDGKQGPYTEQDEPNPISFYGWSKYAAEKLVKHASLRWAITRTVLVYGIAQDMSRSNIILWVKKSLEEGKNIQVVTDQWRTPTLAEDLAMGCYLIAQQEAPGIFHISGAEMLTPYDMAIRTAEYFDLNKHQIAATDASQFVQPARRPPRTGFILDKACQQLGYQPHTFLEGIAIMASQMPMND